MRNCCLIVDVLQAGAEGLMKNIALKMKNKEVLVAAFVHTDTY